LFVNPSSAEVFGDRNRDRNRNAGTEIIRREKGHKRGNTPEPGMTRFLKA
jgi:hypothetical protein